MKPPILEGIDVDSAGACEWIPICTRDRVVSQRCLHMHGHRRTLTESLPTPSGAPRNPAGDLAGAPPHRYPAGTTVLVVDDSITARRVMASRLVARGFKVVEADGGKAALAVLQEVSVDAVLLDVAMPEISGLELLERIRAQEGPLYLPVLMVTADPDNGSLLDALNRGASDYLRKPIQWDLLFARLDMHLGRRMAECEARSLRIGLEQEVQRRTADLERSNADLRESKRLLRAVIDTIPHPLFVKDRESRYLLVNKKLAETVNRKPEELVGLHSRDLPGVLPEAVEEALQEDQQVLSTGAPLIREVAPPRTTNQGGLWRRYIKLPFHDDAGDIVGVVGLAEDITERIRLQSINERNWRALTGAELIAGFGAMEWDLITGAQHWTDGVYRILGIPVPGSAPDAKFFASVLHPDDKKRVLREMSEAVDSGDSFDSHCRIVRPDGCTRIVRAQGDIIRGPMGAAERMVGTVHDVTEAFDAQAEILASRQLLQSVIDTLPFRIAVRDRDGHPLIRNARLRHDVDGLYGLNAYKSIDELLKLPQLAPSLTRWLSEIQRLTRQAIVTGKPQEIAALEVQSPSGEPSIRRLSVHPLIDAERGVQSTVIWSEDITGRVRTEQAFQEARKLESLGMLTAGVVHDLKNLLQVVRGFLQLALLEAGRMATGPGTTALQGHLRQMLEATDGTDGLLRQLLAFSRRSDLRPQPVPVDTHLSNRLRMIQLAVGKEVKVDFLPCAPAANILADPGMLDQVLLNLAFNAKDAMPQGGTLTLATSPMTAGALPASPDGPALSGAFVRIDIRDTGTGMTQEVRDRLFEPFFTTKAKGAGTGLGLSVVHGIVTQHRGQISVESTLNRGTVFHIHWPVI